MRQTPTSRDSEGDSSKRKTSGKHANLQRYKREKGQRLRDQGRRKRKCKRDFLMLQNLLPL